MVSASSTSVVGARDAKEGRTMTTTTNLLVVGVGGSYTVTLGGSVQSGCTAGEVQRTLREYKGSRLLRRAVVVDEETGRDATAEFMRTLDTQLGVG
jgi:hypothetical protein